MRKTLVFILVLTVAISACTTRSISNSGYNSGRYHENDNPLYKGELSEFDVLGIDAGQEISDHKIAEALHTSTDRIAMRKGDAILLIQSGAMIPDGEMIKNLEKYFSVSIFTGVPEREKTNNASYSAALRYAAAKSGIEKIIVYWGILESGTKNLATKTISWVPIVGWAVPDETQEVRIRLKVAVIDVKTGRWQTFVPQTFEDNATSALIIRKQSDQEQVAFLKFKAYQGAVETLLSRYVQ